MAGKGAKSKEPSAIASVYIKFYNLAQTAGWSYIYYLFVMYYLTPGEKSLWETVKIPLIIFQNAAVLEVLHAAVGLVKSNPVITAVQVASRVMLVCGVLIASPPEYAASSIGLPLCIFAWSVTEIIRYAFYFFNLIGSVPYLLVWLRYTTFIVLYPIGITGELLCLYAAQGYFGEHPELLSYALPNSWNFTFSYRYLLLIVMASYIPFFPHLYKHMFTQRKKILGAPSAEKKAR